MTIERRQTSTARGDMSWLEAGAGWPLVLLHAFPLHAGMWRPQLERVPDGWRFLAPDLRGFGATPLGRLPAGERHAIGTYAADVFAILDALEIETVVVTGLSMGGYVALAMHRREGSRLSGLVLADTRAPADTADGRAGRVRMRELLAREGSAGIAAQMLPRLLSDEAGASLRAAVGGMIESADPAGVDAALVAMMDRPDATSELPHLGCPALVVVGALDVVTPTADAEALDRAIPRSSFAVLPGAGHLSNLEQPETFSRALADFLRSRL